jgi:hypothetical protein
VLQAANGVGTLYRYTVSTNYQYLNGANFSGRFSNSVPVINSIGLITNFFRVADGVIHLKLTAYDPQGRRMGWDTTNMYPSYKVLRMSRSGAALGLYSSAKNLIEANVALRQDPYTAETVLVFTSNALPASVELELGVLEPFAVKQLQAMQQDSSPKVAQTFLKKQAARVHLFRQRIPIRTVQQ